MKGHCLKALGAAAAMCAFALSALGAANAAEAPKPASKSTATHTVHAVSLYGEPKYGPDFKHFDYVNPDAPKAGTVRFAGAGSFDSFNAFALRGTSAVNLFNLTMTYDSLMTGSFDERGVQYGELAESITYPDDYSWVEYNLRPNARWHDGKPITAQDVVFTFETMRDHSAPVYRNVFQEAVKAELKGPRKVRIGFKTAGNRRNLLAMGQMAILPKHFWTGKDFEAPIITPPLSSGPYVVGDYELGRSFTWKRVPDYWGKDLAINKGRYNYDRIVTDYYRDTVVSLEAFKAGDFDLRMETSPREWKVGYQWPAAKHGQVVKASIPSSQGFLYQGFFYNLRRPQFQDPVLREALSYAFDFNWMNKNLFYDFFTRTRNYFGNDELGAHGMPSAAELKLLEPFRSQLPPRVFTSEYNPPDTDGTTEGLRKNLSIASQMLLKAGYRIQNGKMISPKTKQPVKFEILMSDPAFQLVSSHWADNLKLLGIDVTLRTMDVSQYIKRVQDFDYDTIIWLTATTGTPGQEQRAFWSSAQADNKGSANYAGVKSPAVDALLDKIVAAQTMDDLLTAVHALDRVLQWNFYSLPHYGGGGSIKVGYWDRFGRPKIDQSFGTGWTDTWWIDPKKDAALKLSRNATN